MKLLILGLPGSGKTTQAQKLAEKFNLCFVKTGTILREMAKTPTPEGVKIREALDKGELVDDLIVARLVEQRLKDEDCQDGFVMDGYPRSIHQIQTFDPEFVKVFYLKVPEEEVRKRLIQRGREDDTPELVDRRLQVQSKELGEVLEFFKKNGELVEIDGSKDEEWVFGQIVNQI